MARGKGKPRVRRLRQKAEGGNESGNDINMSTRVPRAVWKRIKLITAERGLLVKAILAEALAEWVEKHDKKKK